MGEPSRSSAPPRQVRRTRFVCISDTHNSTPKIPHGDVLVHCGDLTNTGSFNELEKQATWLSRQPHEVKIVIAGNHDLTLDTNFYERYSRYHHYHAPQNHLDCQSLFTNTDSLIYLLHESRKIRLSSPAGPHTEFTIFGSPYTPEYGLWAFMYPRYTSDEGNACAKLWSAIPPDTDVLMTHGPAFGHLDQTVGRDAAGCEELRKAMMRVRPRLALCGHIHEARGVERVRWDLESHAGYGEADTGRKPWQDPAPSGDKICLVNLTTKGGEPLENDGRTTLQGDAVSSAVPTEVEVGANPGLSTWSLGGNTQTVRSEETYLAGRLGRKETCIVNCAIQATSYPHTGPRRLQKPVVVDLELPVWE